MADFVNILSNFGFPVAIACYLLFRFEKKLDALEETNRKVVDRNTALVLEIEQLQNKIDRLIEKTK